MPFPALSISIPTFLCVAAPQGSPGLYTLGWSLCERVSVSTADLWSRVSWRSSAASRKRSTRRSWSRTACLSCFRSSGPARYESAACKRVELRGSFVLTLLLNSNDWDVWSALWQKLVWCHCCGGETGQRSHLGAVSPHKTVTRGRNRAVICRRIKEHQIKEKNLLKCSSACKSDQDQCHPLCSGPALTEAGFHERTVSDFVFQEKSALMQATSFDHFPFFPWYINFVVCFCVFAHSDLCTEGRNIFFSVTEEVIWSEPPCFIQVCLFWGAVVQHPVVSS